MDLKSMLNESSGARPSPTPPQPLHQQTRHQTYPSYQGTIHSSLVHQASQRERPSQPPPLQPPEAFSPGTVCNSAQSPSQRTFASTSSINSVGLHSSIGSSPGPGHLSTVRDGTTYNNQYPTSFVPSPSSHAPNQGPFDQYQQIQGPPSGFPAGASLTHSGLLRESPGSLTGPPHSAARQFSPHPSQPSLPGTPLGPPAVFQKPSPQATQRAASYGLEHTRTYSGGSLGSQHGYDYGDRNMSQHQRTASRDSTVRQYSYEREREKSISVSPKTIPQPSPLRQASMERLQPRMTPPLKQSTGPKPDHARLVSSAEPRVDSLPSSTSTTPRDLERRSSSQQSPRAAVQHSTPPSNHAMPPDKSSPTPHRHQALKRNASAISGSSSSPQPPRKRSKRAEIPIFARTARPNKPPLRLIMKGNVRSVPHAPPAVNGHPSTNGSVHQAAPMRAMPVTASVPIEPSDWEPSIMGSTPYEELTRYICDMIYNTIGNAEPPTDGAVFEIEAKLGEIHNIEEGRRIRLPVMTETIFDKNQFGPPTRFESSMNVEQHKALNSYLNTLCAESQQAPRTPMFYDHPRETDTFYSLTPAGEASLPLSIRTYLNPKHRPRVRITTSQPPPSAAGSPAAVPVVKRRIIKSRIADFDVLCPSLAFDFRISISIESPFDGPDDVLVKVNDAGAGGAGDREKDRVSYRHLAYQIDLTQVSYPNSSKREHELEIEISTETIRQELANLREGRPNRYEDLVRGFVDNVRILARKGTLRMQR
ncbi:hypothetical protein GJ744_004228 [Endocarpon pusillum]|uniref:mRNA-capping enzyme subunit beta n=1 Tax=Endocarpon pusillum TaxID=364733 RepID=A0A8H7ADE0_9EURO|nr:hypothetical protein GJ744_004228 [Endocarpon pusillum]